MQPGFPLFGAEHDSVSGRTPLVVLLTADEYNTLHPLLPLIPGIKQVALRFDAGYSGYNSYLRSGYDQQIMLSADPDYGLISGTIRAHLKPSWKSLR